MEIEIIGRRNLTNSLYSRVVNSLNNTKKRVVSFFSSYKATPKTLDSKEILGSLYPDFEESTVLPSGDNLNQEKSPMHETNTFDSVSNYEGANGISIDTFLDMPLKKYSNDSLESVFQDVPKRSNNVDEDKEFERTLDEMFTKRDAYEVESAFEEKSDSLYFHAFGKECIKNPSKTYSGTIDSVKSRVDEIRNSYLAKQVSDLLDVAKGETNWFWSKQNLDGSRSRLSQLNESFRNIYEEHGENSLDSLTKVYDIISENKIFKKKLDEKNKDALKLKRFIEYGQLLQ